MSTLKTYSPIRAAVVKDVALRAELQKMDEYLRQLSLFTARTPTYPQGTPSLLVEPPASSVDLLDYLFLPGRVNGQIAYGSNNSVPNGDYFYDRLILAANKMPQTNPNTAPGTIILSNGATVDVMASVFSVSPNRTLDLFPSQIFLVATSLDDVNGDSANVQSTGYANFDKNETTATFPGYTFKIQNQTVGRPAEDILVVSRNTANTNKHINLTDNLGASYGYMQGSDWLTTGRLVVGTGSFATERLLDLTKSITTNGTVTSFNEALALSSSLTGTANANYAAYAITVTDSNAFTAGTYATTGLTISVTGSPPAGVTLSTLSGFNGTANVANVSGSLTTVVGGIWTAQGAAGAATAITTLIGLRLLVGQRVSTVTTARGIELSVPSGGVTGAVTDFVGIDYLTSFGTGTNVVNWHGIRHTAGPTAGSTNQLWFFDLTSSRSGLSNRILYKTALGWNPANNAAVTAMLHLGAGTATLAPLQFTTGTSLTTALAGAMEFTTDDLFFTITTGTARKRVLFADATGGLTSGRVPYVTTNGRLIDTAGFTFSGTDLAVPGNITATGAANTFGTAGTAQVFTIGQGGAGSDNATLNIQAAATGVPAIYLYQQATEYARWTKDGGNTTWIGTGTLQFQQETAVGTSIFKMGAGGATAGVAGTAHTSTFGQGTTGSDASVVRVRSGDSGSTTASLFLTRNTTDMLQLLTNGTDSFVDFVSTGSGVRFRAGLGGGGTEVIRFESTGPRVLGGLRIRFDGFTDGAGVGAGTITNAPAAGNPAFWLKVNIAGTDRFIPCW